MPKVKLAQDPEMTGDGLPPLPDGPEDLIRGPENPDIKSDSRLIGSSPATEVDKAFAGDLIALPFEAGHIVYPPIDPLTEHEKERLAAPFAEILNKYNLGGKLSRAEIVFAFYLTAAVAGRVQKCAAYEKQKKIEANAAAKNLEDGPEKGA